MDSSALRIDIGFICQTLIHMWPTIVSALPSPNVIKLFPVNFIACWKWFRTGIVQLARGNDGGKGRRFIEPL